MYITNLCLSYQHNAKNAKKRKRLSPNERKYVNYWIVTKFGIDTLFFLLTFNITFLSKALVNLRVLLSACLTLLHQLTALHDKWQIFLHPIF